MRRIRPLLAAVVVGAMISSSPALGQEDEDEGKRPPPVNPVQRAAALARPAVVYVGIHWRARVLDRTNNQYFNNGQPLEATTVCSGFAVNPDGHIATAGHCVDEGVNGATRIFARRLVSQGLRTGAIRPEQATAIYRLGLIVWKVEGDTPGSPPDRQVFVQRGTARAGRRSGDAVPARVVDSRPLREGDVALLKVDQSNLPAVEVAPATDVQIGSEVISIGYPASAQEVTDETLEPTNKDGTVSAKRTTGGSPVYEVSAAHTAGMSGGPSVDHDGRAIGLVSFRPAEERQAFNFISPSSAVLEILDRNAIRNQLGPVDHSYRQGLDLFFNGHYREATRRFDEALRLFPAHQQAKDYKQQAAQQIAAGRDIPLEKEGDGLPVVLVIAVVVGALAVIGAVVGVIAARAGRKRRPVPAPQTGPGPGGVAPAPPPPPGAAPEPGPGPPPGEPAEHREGEDEVATQAVAEPRASEDRVCGSCGTPVAPGGRFCAQCGAPLDGGVSSPGG